MEWQITGGTFSIPEYPYTSTTASGPSVTLRLDGDLPATITAHAYIGTTCEATASVVVPLRTIAPPEVIHPDTVCANRVWDASVSTTAGGPWRNAMWRITNGYFRLDSYQQSTSTTGLNVQFVPSGDGPVSLSVEAYTDDMCTASSEISIPLRSSVGPVINAPSSACVRSIASASVAPGGATDVWWNIRNGMFKNPDGSDTGWIRGSAVLFYGDGSGPVTLDVEAFDADGCSTRSEATVDILQATPAIEVGVRPIPIGAPVAARAIAPPTASYTSFRWTIDGGVITSGADQESMTFVADGTKPVMLGVSVTDNRGCSGAVASRFLLAGTPLVIDGPLSYCSTAATKTATAYAESPISAVQWTVTGGTILAGATSPTLSFVPAGSGDVILSVTALVGGETTTASKSVPYAAPSIVGTTSSERACKEEAITADVVNSADFVNFSWDSPYGMSIYQMGPGGFIKFEATDDDRPYILTITGITAEGCTATWTKTYELPWKAEFVPSPAALCEGGVQSLAIANQEIFRSWDWGIMGGVFDPPVATGTSPPSVSYRATGTGPVTVYAKMHPVDNTCAAFSRYVVPRAALPAAPTITASGPTTLCTGGSVTLQAPEAFAYQWSNGETSRSITVSTSGTYTVSVSNESGCSATSEAVAVTVNDLPPATITASGPTTFCEGGSVTLTASDALSYLWSTGETTQAIVVSHSGNYSVTVTNANGCSATSDATAVSVNPAPPKPGINAYRMYDLAKTGPSIAAAGFCQGDSIGLTVWPYSTSYTYLWSTGATSRSIETTTSGTFTVTATDANGCSTTSDPVVINVYPHPAITIATTPNCNTNSVTLTASGADSYLWSNGQTGASIVVAQNGNYSVTGIANGCSGSASTNVSTLPAISANGPLKFCSGGSVTLTAPYGTSYLWSTGATARSITVSQGGDYSVSVTNGGCTLTSAPAVVSVVPALTAQVPMPAGEYCEGSPVTMHVEVAGGVPPYSYQWGNGRVGEFPGATSDTYTGPATDAYYWVRVYDSGTCGMTEPLLFFHAYPPPVAEITAPTSTVCDGSSINLYASSGTAWLWSTGETTSSISVSQPGSYSVTVTGYYGSCTATSEPFVVTSAAPPAATITASGPTTFCVGGSVTLTASDGTSYLWSNGATTQSIVVTQGGGYSVTVTNASGCSATSPAVAVTISPKPDATISASGPTTFCEGGAVTLTASSGTSYLWSNGSTTQSIVASQNGNYNVTVTNANGCSATSAPVAVVVNPKPAATISASGPTTICEGGSVTLTASSGAAYLWSNGATTQSIVVSQAGNYSVTVTSASGCSATSAPVAVAVNPKPNATISASGPTAFCEGGSVTLTASSGVSYAWSTGETSQSIVVSNSGAYSVTVLNANGCSAISSPTVVEVLIPAKPLITVNGSATFCDGGQVQLSSSPAASYLWSNGSTSNSIMVNASGVFTVTVTYANGCSAISDPVVVTENIPQKPTITASGPTTFCEGGSVTLTASEGSSYHWSNGATTRSIVVDREGSLSVTVKDANGCFGYSDPVDVSILPLPNGLYRGTVNVCAGGHGYTASMREFMTDLPFASYAWAIENGVITSGQGTPAITYDPVGTGSVKLSVVYTGANGCSNTGQYEIPIIEPVATITADGPTAFCPGGSVTLTANPGVSYAWSNGQTTQSITVTQPGTYTVHVFATSTCGVTSSPVVVNYKSSPTATVVQSYARICRGSSYVIGVNLTGTAPWSISWSDGFVQSGITSSVATRVVSPSEMTDYYVTQISDAICSGVPVSGAVARVWVEEPPTAVVTGTTTVCSGTSATIQAALTGTAPWIVTWSDGYVQTIVTTNGLATRQVAPASTTTYSVMSMSDQFCTAGTSSGGATVTVNTPAMITTQPASVAIKKNTTTTLTVAATGTTPLTYQWYRGTAGTTTYPVGTNSPSYATPKLLTTTSYWVKVSNACGSANSATATVTIK